KPLQQLVVEKRIKHDTRRFFDFSQDAVELLLGANQGINVLYRRDLGVLRSRRTRDRGQCLTGRIRDKVKMKIAAGTLWHDNGGTSCGFWRRRPRAKPNRKSAIGGWLPTLPSLPLGILWEAPDQVHRVNVTQP